MLQFSKSQLARACGDREENVYRPTIYMPPQSGVDWTGVECERGRGALAGEVGGA